MNQLHDYKIFAMTMKNRKLHEFEDAIKKLIKDGWVPLGGVIVTPGEELELVQTLIRCENESFQSRRGYRKQPCR